MAAVIMMADLRQIQRLCNTGHLVNIAQKAIQIAIVTNAVPVALEVSNIHRVKAYQRGPQAQIGFSQAIAGEIAMLSQDLLQPRQ